MKLKTNLEKGIGGFEPLDDGWYEAEIVRANPAEASTGTSYLDLELQVIGPRHEGRHLWDQLYMTEGASWKTEALMNAAGLELGKEIETDELIDRRVSVKVGVRLTDSGESRNEIRRYRRMKEESNQ